LRNRQHARAHLIGKSALVHIAAAQIGPPAQQRYRSKFWFESDQELQMVRRGAPLAAAAEASLALPPARRSSRPSPRSSSSAKQDFVGRQRMISYPSSAARHPLSTPVRSFARVGLLGHRIVGLAQLLVPLAGGWPTVKVGGIRRDGDSFMRIGGRKALPGGRSRRPAQRRQPLNLPPSSQPLAAPGSLKSSQSRAFLPFSQIKVGEPDANATPFQTAFSA
jgi:hypothetical protein